MTDRSSTLGPTAVMAQVVNFGKESDPVFSRCVGNDNLFAILTLQ